MIDDWKNPDATTSASEGLVLAGHESPPASYRNSCFIVDLGLISYSAAYDLQKRLVAVIKNSANRSSSLASPESRVTNHVLLLCEHPHVITLGRSGKREHLLASERVLQQKGVEFHATDRGGDITYHGPGQIVGYPIFDLREWKRDVVAYVRAIEQVIIDALAEFAINAGRLPGCTGVWVDGKKIAAIGVHISRWVTSHGFALNHTTDLSYFQYIVPCGLTKPVTSMQALGSTPSRTEVTAALTRAVAKNFEVELLTETFS